MRKFVVGALVAALSPAAGHARAQTPNGWALLARADIEAIHDVLRTNHPGPVDPVNPAYGRWLAEGREQALARADAATSYRDYLRSLRLYVNGFRDGHIGLAANVSPTPRWPGFAVEGATDGAARIVEVAPNSTATVGSEIISCGGRTVDDLMRERIDPYYWNTAIPHERPRHLARLFLSAAGQQVDEWASCTIRTPEGADAELPLTWSSLDPARARAIAANSPAGGPPAMRQVDGVWIVSIPTFQFQQADQAAVMTALIAEVQAKAPELADATIVFDVRGNTGGNSVWGERLARALWGDASVNHVESAFDYTVDYRVSQANIEALNFNIARARRDGLNAAAVSGVSIRDKMVEALAKGEAFLPLPSPASATAADAPASPFRGRAWFLTDGDCASACLDFADIMRRLPHVTHIGAATSADAVYIDNNGAPLPSGLSTLSYSLKVYRHRVRANNEWYEPQVKWPGEPAKTDAELVAWVRSLGG